MRRSVEGNRQTFSLWLSYGIPLEFCCFPRHCSEISANYVSLGCKRNRKNSQMDFKGRNQKGRISGEFPGIENSILTCCKLNREDFYASWFFAEEAWMSASSVPWRRNKGILFKHYLYGYLLCLRPDRVLRHKDSPKVSELPMREHFPHLNVLLW